MVSAPTLFVTELLRFTVRPSLNEQTGGAGAC